MASSYSTIGRLELMASTEKIDIWGPIANSNINLLEAMIAGAETISTTSGTVVLTTNNGAADQARKAFLICTGALVGNLILEIPNLNKHYLIYNRTTNAFSVTVKTNSGAAITIPQGAVAFVACDASNVTSFFSPPVDPATGGLFNALSFSDFPSGTQGDVLYHDGSNWGGLGAGTAGQALLTGGAGADPTWGNPSATSTKNALINGAMMVSQRNGAGSVSGDDIYTLDRWIGLGSISGNSGYTQSVTSPPAGAVAFMVMGPGSLGSAVKIGACQIIEQKNCAHLVGGNVTLSFKMAVTDDTLFTTMKAAILSWDGAADAVTSDIVSAWNGDGTTPTFVANWTLENTPVDLNATEAWASYSVTANIDTANTKNIAVFIWSDASVSALGQYFSITEVQLEAGTSATSFERRDIEDEIDRCSRYYIHDTHIGEGGYASAGSQTGRATAGVSFQTTMRTTPTITFSSTSYGNASGINATNATERGFFANVTSSAAGSVYWSSLYAASAEL